MAQSIYQKWIEKDSNDNEWSQHALRQWIKALEFLLPNFEQINNFYVQTKIKQNKLILEADGVHELCSNLGMALNFYSNLNSLSCENIDELQTLVIICWYYGIYFSSRAMCLSIDINFKNNTHSGVCDYWLEKISKKELVLCPFNLHVSSILQDDVKKYLSDQGCYEPNFLNLKMQPMQKKYY